MDENLITLILLLFIMFSIGEVLYVEWKVRQSENTNPEEEDPTQPDRSNSGES